MSAFTTYLALVWVFGFVIGWLGGRLYSGWFE